ncbi:hypothetical protein K1719_005590 [Acacia pycnantha]|nr:hypothetical protein K1719_005590 [Acacia pycnantha]
MPSCSNAQSMNVGCAKDPSILQSNDSHEIILKTEEAQDKEEGEEGDEEDADFNPFVKETPSQEASSSLSSEVDGVDGGVVDSSLPVDMNLSILTIKEPICAVEDCEHGEEEIAMHSSLSEDGTCEQELQKNATCSSKKRKSILNSESETTQEKDNGLSCKTDDYASKIGEINNATKPQSPVVETDANDAICTRTRARYSLARFTLDELETFLQESDDDDELQNVDDEEEYRKFLSAVLQGGGDEGLSSHGNENVDDEDEDNDADFEIELEELLESDVEENAAVKTRKEYEGATRRPETRQNRRQKVSSQCEKKTLGLAKKPLRPILPNLPNGPPASGKGLMPDVTMSFQSSTSGNGLVNGFTPQQIGQLRMLIHEHVQLLIQVFSLSVFDPSRQQIATQVQDLLFELLHKRDKVVSSKSVPYPSICFFPSNGFSSVSDGGQFDIESSCTYDAQRMFLSQSNQCSSEGRCGYNSRRSNSSQDIEGSLQSSFVRGPIISILDVAPLNFVGRFVDDVHSAIQECRNRYLKSGCDMHAEKEPLFPCFLSNATNEVSSGTTSAADNVVSTSPGQQQPKKTLAAMLVESTMKQSIASVPKEIAELTQRFLPMFNPVFFPHKPPPPAVVNRVLFTDSEDELLALGLFEYNTDWKAIQQRFLPCKSKHQIFVRQKNRCSSKAPENPIKAVRQMKTSPLTAEEIARIHEGLKVYKFDWISIWQYLVPHRDPSLLPRQWRIALGTQKSYKLDAAKKEKRRLYELKRRNLKAASSESWQAVSDKEGCEDEIAGTENWMDDSDVAYVHQAFLADWRPETSFVTCPERSPAKDREGNLVNDAMSQEASQNFNSQQTQNSVCGKAGPKIGDRGAFPFVSKLPQFQISSDLRSGLHGVPSAIKNPVFDMTTSSTKYFYRPYRSRKLNSSHLVKLAPDLPPVNLPPSVRVVSQTAFKGYQCGTSKIYPSGGGVASHRKDHSAPISPAEKCGNVHPVMSTRLTAKDNGADSQLERSGTVGCRSFAEKGPSSDLEMHPLLFQATENTSYYPLKFSSGTSSSFSFFSGAQPQLNLSLFHRHQQQNHDDGANKSSKSKGCTSRSSGVGFHPLLQKSNDSQLQTSFDAIQNESPMASCMPAKDTSCSINGKSNELDLDIHLSHASGKEKSIEIRHPEANDPMGCTVNVTNCGTAGKPLETGVPCSQEGDKSPTVSSSKLVSCAHPQLLVSPNDNISRCDIDDLGDNSHPEIVMEQEELSDSEEDLEEHVEFECEEMADSEGENSSGCEQLIEAHDKEILNSAVEKVTTESFLMGDSSEPRSISNTQAHDSPLRDDILAAKMAVSSEGKDKSCTAWLSLDSRSADSDVLSKIMHEVGGIDETMGTTGEAPNSEKFELSRTSRCCKKSKSCDRAADEDRHTIDMVQQLNLGPVVFATPKKRRKHSGKAKSSLNIGLTVESSNHGDNHR